MTIQQQEGNYQKMNNNQRETLADYLSGFEQPERARAFLDDILVRHNDEQWAAGGLITMLDTIADQKSLEDVKAYIAELQTHLSDWTNEPILKRIN